MKGKTLVGVQSPLLWLGLSLLAALGPALFFSDGLTHLARASAAYQRQIQVLFSALAHSRLVESSATAGLVNSAGSSRWARPSS